MLIDCIEGVKLLRLSHLIETEAVGPPQSKYLNGVAEIETTLSPHRLKDELHAIEAALGRDRSRETRWGPRTCDLDLLLYGELVVNEPDLTLPHPRLHQRRFVLEPLAEIAPEVVHPVLNKTAAELLARLEKSNDQFPTSNDQ